MKRGKEDEKGEQPGTAAGRRRPTTSLEPAIVADCEHHAGTCTGTGTGRSTGTCLGFLACMDGPGSTKMFINVRLNCYCDMHFYF